jgi:hypothetical protein
LKEQQKAKEILQRSYENNQEHPAIVNSRDTDNIELAEDDQEKSSAETVDDINPNDSDKETSNDTGSMEFSDITNPNGPDNTKDVAYASQNISKITNPYQKAKKVTRSLTQDKPARPSSMKHSTTPGLIDKQIALKKGMLRNHMHRYTLRIKIISSKSEEDEQILIQKTLQKFFDIVLQGDPKSIMPPYFELDRSDISIPDLSSTFNVEALDSYYSLKRYFSRLSPRSTEGFVWSSIILAQSIPFAAFMEKTRHSLENQAFSHWPKASDHELAADIGWLLYSTRQQDEERLAEMISTLTGEKIGVKWKPIRTTDGSIRAKDKDKTNESRVYALHLECAANKAQDVRIKLSKWYGSSSKQFPDGTKMRLVPPFNTILSSGNKQKYASLIARQSTLNSRLGSASS